MSVFSHSLKLEFIRLPTVQGRVRADSIVFFVCGSVTRSSSCLLIFAILRSLWSTDRHLSRPVTNPSTYRSFYNVFDAWNGKIVVRILGTLVNLEIDNAIAVEAVAIVAVSILAAVEAGAVVKAELSKFILFPSPTLFPRKRCRKRWIRRYPYRCSTVQDWITSNLYTQVSSTLISR